LRRAVNINFILEQVVIGQKIVKRKSWKGGGGYKLSPAAGTIFGGCERKESTTGKNKTTEIR